MLLLSLCYECSVYFLTFLAIAITFGSDLKKRDNKKESWWTMKRDFGVFAFVHMALEIDKTVASGRLLVHCEVLYAVCYGLKKKKPTGRINYITISKCHNTVNVTVKLITLPIIYYSILSWCSCCFTLITFFFVYPYRVPI